MNESAGKGKGTKRRHLEERKGVHEGNITYGFLDEGKAEKGREGKGSKGNAKKG